MIHKAISLHNTKGTSDKVYHLQIIGVENNKYVVQFQYGRRGKTLKFGTKTGTPTSIYNAENIFDDLLNQKKKKGYFEIPNPPDLLMIIGLST